MSLRARLEAVLERANHQVLTADHPTLRLLVQNVAGRPGIVIELEQPLGVEIPEMRGLDILVEWPTASTGYLRIASTHRGVTPGYFAVVEHLLTQARAAEDSHEAISAVVGALEELRAMFGSKRGRLGEDAIRGLYAELTLLERLLLRGDSALAVVLSWNGPFGGSKDFVFPDGRAVEVKSAHRPPTKVTVSNVAQLDPGGVHLSLAVLPMERVVDHSEGSRSLTRLVTDVRELLAAEVTAGELFADALDAVGLELADSFYDQWAFQVGEHLWFEVRPDFPRIRAESVDAGVSRVKFDLELSALGAFVAAPQF